MGDMVKCGGCENYHYTNDPCEDGSSFYRKNSKQQDEMKLQHFESVATPTGLETSAVRDRLQKDNYKSD